nr:MAG TPA: hypothetical protein [Caudoviricetes sp.]
MHYKTLIASLHSHSTLQLYLVFRNTLLLLHHSKPLQLLHV